MSTLEQQYIDAATRFGGDTAERALAEWIIGDDRSAQLAHMPAVRNNSNRLTAATLTAEHIGWRVSFARVGSAGAKARVAGTLKRIDRAVRANGMPGYRLLVAREEHGPLAPHHEVIVTELPRPAGRMTIRRHPAIRTARTPPDASVKLGLQLALRYSNERVRCQQT